MDVVLALVLSLVAVAVTMTVTALRARQLGVVAVVDVAWGLGFVLSAVVVTLYSLAADDADARRWLVLAMVVLWGGRLAWHVRSRFLGEHEQQEDPRYEELMGGSLAEAGFEVAVKKVFLTQGGVQWFIGLPVTVGAVLGTASVPVVVLGVVVWAIGFAFEVIGDRQLTAYKAQPKDQRPKVMDQGLWGWTRHPNYFGDATVWWGLWLTAALSAGWLPGLLTVLCPVAMTIFIRNVTGAKRLEKTMSQREGWDEYAARVPMFFPRPPRS